MDNNNNQRRLQSEPLKSQYFAPFTRLGYIHDVEWCQELNILAKKAYFDNQEKVEDCEIFDDDVIICGHLKSGILK